MNLQKLRDRISERFDLDEIRDLSFDLGIEYENLDGNKRYEKARALVEYCERRGWLLKLLNQCKKSRPDHSWQEVTEAVEQWPPQIREDKLAFLCWVYIKSDGSTFQPASPDEISNMMKLSESETIRVAEYLTASSLLEFSRWVMGIKITHQGILKAENDLLQGFLRDDFPFDITSKIKEVQRKRLNFLRCLYKKSKPLAFEPVSGIEIANEIGSDHYQLASQGILNYLHAEGWLHFRGEPSIQITETGIEKVEAEN